MTPADAYADLVARAAPGPGITIAFRRVYAGRELEHPRLVGERPFVHFESREPPTDVPAGARWVTTHSENLDGGPSLMNRIAILDLPYPHALEDVAALEPRWAAFLRVPRLVARLHDALAAWGTQPLRTIAWESPRFALGGLVGSMHPEHPLARVRGAVRELVGVHLDGGVRAEAAAWQQLAARDEVWPRQTDDTYYPGIWIADDWVGRRIADTPNPFPALLELEESGFFVVALAGDEATLVLP